MKNKKNELFLGKRLLNQQIFDSQRHLIQVKSGGISSNDTPQIS
jgi:hypothetical protein